MLNHTKFSAIIPTYNRAHLISRAIESALAQTLSPAEVIVVDDGSTDDTKSVCERFGDRIRYIQRRNGSASAARNTGAAASTYPWLAFLDSDDIWTKDHLERIARAIQATSGRAAFYFDDLLLTKRNGNTSMWAQFRFVTPQTYAFVEDATTWMLMLRQPAAIPCTVFSRDKLLESGLFDETFRASEDVELYCRLGMGNAACAVAGIGCIQTDDDRDLNRLTGKFTEVSPIYWKYFIRIWSAVAKRKDLRLLPHQISLIRFNLAESYLCLARTFWRSGNWIQVPRPLTLALVTDPHLAIWLLRYRTSRGYAHQLWEKNFGRAYPTNIYNNE